MGKWNDFSYPVIFGEWAAVDPAAAVAKAEQMAPGQQKNQVIDAIARRWAEDDPEIRMGLQIG